MDNAQFQADPLSAVINHVLNSVPPPPDTDMRSARSGHQKKRVKRAPQQQGAARGAGEAPLVLHNGHDEGRGRLPPPHDVHDGGVRKRRFRW